jgi:tRNA-2-methylthio-N6-dimethylallyladenosine synthase
LMEIIRFDSAFTFLYSRRTGTSAAEDPDQVPDSIKKERFERLVRLQNAHSLASNKKLEGQVVELLVEGASSRDEHIFSGRTSQNHLVNFHIPSHVSLPDHVYQENGQIDGARLEGSLAQVRIDQARTFSLMGTLEDWQP